MQKVHNGTYENSSMILLYSFSYVFVDEELDENFEENQEEGEIKSVEIPNPIPSKNAVKKEEVRKTHGRRELIPVCQL